jgi:hypothetical protein
MTSAAVSASRCLLGRSPGRIHFAARLHVVDCLPSGGDQRPQGERHEEEDENQAEAGRVTNKRGPNGLWPAVPSTEKHFPTIIFVLPERLMSWSATRNVNKLTTYFYYGNIRAWHGFNGTNMGIELVNTWTSRRGPPCCSGRSMGLAARFGRWLGYSPQIRG